MRSSSARSSLGLSGEFAPICRLRTAGFSSLLEITGKTRTANTSLGNNCVIPVRHQGRKAFFTLALSRPIAHNLSSCCYSQICWPQAFKERLRRRQLTNAAKQSRSHMQLIDTDNHCKLLPRRLSLDSKTTTVQGPGEGVFTPEALLAHEQQLLVLGVLLDAGIKLWVGLGEGVPVQQANVVVVEELQNKCACKDIS